MLFRSRERWIWLVRWPRCDGWNRRRDDFRRTTRRLTLTGRRDRKSTRLNSSHTEIYTLSLHDALPISGTMDLAGAVAALRRMEQTARRFSKDDAKTHADWAERSEERRVGKECRSLCDWSSDVCSSDLGNDGFGWCGGRAATDGTDGATIFEGRREDSR